MKNKETFEDDLQKDKEPDEKSSLDFEDLVFAEIPSKFLSLKDSVENGSKLTATIHASTAGVINGNSRFYKPTSLNDGVFSVIDKPFVRHHRDDDEPIGRTVDAWYENLITPEIKTQFPNIQKKSYWKNLEKQNLDFKALIEAVPNGLGRLMIKNNITDKDAIEKTLDRRYLGISMKFRTDKFICSCGKDKASMWAIFFGEEDDDDDDENPKCKVPSGTIDKEGIHHFNIPCDMKFAHSSVVNEPADPYAKILQTELVDMVVVKDNTIISPPERTVFDLGKDSYNINMTKENSDSDKKPIATLTEDNKKMPTLQELIDSTPELKDMVANKEQEISKLSQDNKNQKETIDSLNARIEEFEKKEKDSLLDSLASKRNNRGLKEYSDKESAVYKKLAEKSLEYLQDALSDELDLEKVSTSPLAPTENPGLEDDKSDEEEEKTTDTSSDTKKESVSFSEFSGYLTRTTEKSK